MPESAHGWPGSLSSRRALREAELRSRAGRHGRSGRHGDPEPLPQDVAGRHGHAAPAAAAPPPIPPVLSLPNIDIAPICSSADRPEPMRPKRRAARAFSASFGLAGAAALAFAFTTSGLSGPTSASAQAAAQQQQHLGTASSPATAYEVLAEVAAETVPADALTSFTNYADAAVQYPFAEPVMLTDGFGERDFPVAGFHDAQDFAAPFGTPIQAMADGTVLEAGWAQDGCGFGLKLQHRIDGKDVTSRYCHMWEGSNAFAVGDKVVVGQEVGRVGSTGISFGPHLHFVIQVDGQAVDPMPFLLKYNRSTRR